MTDLNYKQFFNEGFTVIDNILNENDITSYKNKLDNILHDQRNDFSENSLKKIGEYNMVRSPLLYDDFFIKLINNDLVKNVTSKILGDFCILHLQNGIVIPPNQKHHQSFYHRDIIHQEFVSSKPLGVNFYYCLDDYSSSNGGTTFLKKSHKNDLLDINNDEEITPNVKKGSVIIFDSMVYHKAGSNSTDNFRYGINNMFTLPFLKQQLNYSSLFKNKFIDDDYLSRIFGCFSQEFKSISDFRKYRINKIND